MCFYRLKGSWWREIILSRNLMCTERRILEEDVQDERNEDEMMIMWTFYHRILSILCLILRKIYLTLWHFVFKLYFSVNVFSFLSSRIRALGGKHSGALCHSLVTLDNNDVRSISLWVQETILNASLWRLIIWGSMYAWILFWSLHIKYVTIDLLCPTTLLNIVSIKMKWKLTSKANPSVQSPSRATILTQLLLCSVASLLPFLAPC